MLWYMSSLQLFTIISIFAGLSYVVGWLSDLLLQKVGFGPVGNGAFILLGAFTGMCCYNMQGNFLFRDVTETYFVIGFGAFSMIVFMASIKRFIMH